MWTGGGLRDLGAQNDENIIVRTVLNVDDELIWINKSRSHESRYKNGNVE